MESVADAARWALQERVAAMTVDERLALTERLAEEDLDLYCAAQGPPRDEAKRRLIAQRQAGRRPSCAARER